MSDKISLTRTDVLLIVDIQNDFCPNGALAVPHGDEVVPVVNRLARRFEHVILTQEWHPAGHGSFASTHPGRRPYEIVSMPYECKFYGPTTASRTRPARHSAMTLTFPTLS